MRVGKNDIIMIHTSTKLNNLKSFIKAKDHLTAVKRGMEFLHYVGNEYERLEIYNDQYYDGEDLV